MVATIRKHRNISAVNFLTLVRYSLVFFLYTASVEVRSQCNIDKVVIRRLNSDFCETGSAILQADPSDDTAFTYTWYFSATPASEFAVIPTLLTSNVTVFDKGYYRVSASGDNCTAFSEIINIGQEGDILYLFSKEGSELELCTEREYELSILSREGANYVWEYAPHTEEDAYEVIATGTSEKLAVRGSGLYKVSGEYGFCSFTSQPVSVKFTADSLFAPNVFTPNGDAFNPEFRIETTFEITQFKVFNRYGTEIYSSSVGNWNGGTAPPGIYYWMVRYHGCDSRSRQSNGWVQLIR